MESKDRILGHKKRAPKTGAPFKVNYIKYNYASFTLTAFKPFFPSCTSNKTSSF